jgi:hypothetical protein
VDEGFSFDETDEEDQGPSEPSVEFTSCGASDGSRYPAKGNRCALTRFATVRWSMGPRGWIRRANRGALRNGGVYGHEANQRSTGEAAGLLKQLQKVDASIAHKHTQQIDCTGVLNTDAKVDGFTGTDWVVQADRREWLKTRNCKGGSERDRAPPSTRDGYTATRATGKRLWRIGRRSGVPKCSTWPAEWPRL